MREIAFSDLWNKFPLTFAAHHPIIWQITKASLAAVYAGRIWKYSDHHDTHIPAAEDLDFRKDSQ
jgi:hypothetical protein